MTGLTEAERKAIEWAHYEYGMKDAGGVYEAVERILADRQTAADQRLRDALAGFEALAETWEAFAHTANQLRAVIAAALGVNDD